MRHFLILLISFTLTFFSCQENPKNTPEYVQMERILAIHDAVMPEMGTISGLIGQLEPAFDADSTLLHYASAVEDLKMANGAMMQWMMDFSEDFTTDEIMGKTMIDSEKQNLLDRYEESANSLKLKMLGAIEQAQDLTQD
ncbi:MAG: hypothetical protein O3A41_00210 [Bacteroidetes bacterium]|nr:hypothetical protein [Bacteroidota bacterium]